MTNSVRHYSRNDVFLSVLTLGELRSGISRLSWGRKRADLEVWFSTLQAAYGDRILNVDGDIARAWGELTGRLRATGTTLAPADGLIAATALHHDMTIMTRNTKHFALIGMHIIDPWAALP